MGTSRRSAAAALALAAIGFTPRAAPQERVVRGFVVDFRGAPVAGATVVLSDREAGGNRLGTTTTDARGSFEIRARSSEYHYVEVAHPDFPPAMARFNDHTPLRVTLRRAFRVQGVALKRHGTPFAGAQVVVWSSSPGGSERRSIRAMTGDDGSFAIDGVPPGSLKIGLFDRTARILIDGTHVPPSAVPESGIVTVKFTRRPVHVHGRVLWSGAALPDVLVYPSGGERPEARPSLRPPEEFGRPSPERAITLTSKDGLFEMFLPPGPVWLAVERRDRARDFGRQTVEVPDEEECSLDVDLAPMLSGVVVDKATGEGIPGAVLHIRLESGARARGPRAGWQLAGSDGSFSLNLEPGDYILQPFVQDYERVQVPVAIGSGPHPDIHLELVRALTISGRVLVPGHASPDDLDASPRSLVARSADGRHTAQGSFNEDGSFSLGGLLPVPYGLCVGSPESGWALMTGVEAGTDNITLALQAPGQLDLVVRDPAGQPLEGAFATVVSVSRAPIVVPGLERGVSDATGRLRLAVPAGALEVSVFSQAYKELLEVEVDPAGTVHLELKLREPRELAPRDR